MRRRRLRVLEIFFWVVAVLALGIFSFVFLDRNVYQAYRDWAFDRALAGEPAPVVGFLLHSIRFGGGNRPVSRSPESFEALHRSVPAPPARKLEPEELIGRLEVPRLGIRAMVVHGTSSRALRRAVGHIENTALPGAAGNMGIAGHRDTFFRGLRDIRVSDTVRIRTIEHTFEYQVESVKIVSPDDVAVLKASVAPSLTMVTCYPFDYLGLAPKRFIVHARQVTPGAQPGVVSVGQDRILRGGW